MATINVQRFIDIQDEYNHYETALKEIKDGRKLSHWIWYIFPQIKGLGHSMMSKTYSIDSLLEAKAYWENDILHARLKEITEALLSHTDDSAEFIFGGLDARKVKSCMTLFNIVSPNDIFKDVLDSFYNSAQCKTTLSRVSAELQYYTDKSAFERNGINKNMRGFFEGSSHEAQNITCEQTTATFFDLLQRGDSMQKLTAYYLWHKDFTSVRINDVELGMTNHIQMFVSDCMEEVKDKDTLALLNKLYVGGNDIQNVFDAAKYFDDALTTLLSNAFTREMVTIFVKNNSLAKPIVHTPQREYHGVIRPEFTPSKLSELKPDEVFVFGSNLNGYHGGGAARAAMNKFGAEWGKGVGLQGQSYAIPTMQGGVETIQPYVDDFIAFAKCHEELFFYVTRIGCGIAGFKDEDIAPLFAAAQCVENICLPKSFAEIVKPTFPKEMRQMMYGQMRTLVDMLKAINKAKPIIDARDAMAEVHGVLERNVRYGDEFAFMAWRTIRCVLGKYDHDGCPIDFEKLEKDMYDFHKGNGLLVEDTLQDVMYRYSACKMVKYIQFLNEFRRYKWYVEISNDLTSIPFSHCSSNEPNYYFSFGQFPLYVLQSILRDEWKNIAPNGILDNESLEDIMMGRYQKALAEYGICELIRRSYGDVGCHPDIQGPKIYDVDEPIYGPYFRIDGKHIEKGCSDFRRYPFNSQEFEMQFASELLDKDENYIHVGEGRWNEYYIPRQDMTLPVYSRIKGKLHFDTEEEKLTFIEQQRRNAR